MKHLACLQLALPMFVIYISPAVYFTWLLCSVQTIPGPVSVLYLVCFQAAKGQGEQRVVLDSGASQKNVVLCVCT